MLLLESANHAKHNIPGVILAGRTSIEHRGNVAPLMQAFETFDCLTLRSLQSDADDLVTQQRISIAQQQGAGTASAVLSW
jgi:hypothetical protein